MPILKLSQNQSRIIYDFFICFITAGFVFYYNHNLLGLETNSIIFAAPALVLLCNTCLGIYTKFRVDTGKTKTILLTLSLAITAGFLNFKGLESTNTILWLALSWTPLVFPRIFLNFNTRHKSGLINDVIIGKRPILVVGGAGYIGSYVVAQLLNEGYAVRVFDKFIYSKESLAEFENNKSLEVIPGDVTDITKLTEAVIGVSAVIHLAGLVGDPACAVDEKFTRHTNIIATRMLKEVAISAGVRRFIFASSCSVYGANEEEVDETSSLNPVSMYAQTKIDSEKELLSQINEDFCITILRFATVFGHSRRPRFDLVGNLFTAQAINEGKITVIGENQWRPFIHVKDLARAVVMTFKADQEVINREVFNVGDSRLNLTIGNLAKGIQTVVQNKTQKTVEIITNNNISDKRNYLVSFKKIKKILGYEASVSLNDGVAEMVEEFQKGTYNYYRDSIYSNLEMTKKALENFKNPSEATRLYGPISDDFHSTTLKVANE